ncbi:hypothetical protein SORBI_3003G087700 [Sorghum bicolor]|uniref:Uncharacterized protein n=1 Tax=Sorghum bicolor TaxID=4558 RepID=A0A1W0VWC7_SORBI|nr:hypothetical protein SORBI_3003G087700 [Sorghum bicolor]
MEGGGGKLAYSYGGVEPRKFGLGLVAGLLLVSCAYFSTVKLDAVHLVMSKQPFQPQAYSGLQDQGSWSSSKEGSKAEVLEKDDGDGSNGISSFGQVPVSSLEENQKDETFARNNGGVVVSAASPDPAADGGKDEVPEKDDDPSAAAALPPLSTDSSDSTQESSGVLEDQELQVQNAVAAAANPPKESNSIRSNDNGSSSEIPSDPAEIPVPAPSPEIEPPSSANEISADSSELKAAPPFQMTPSIPEVKQTDLEAPVREWKPLCDLTSNYRIDWCELEGDVRVVGSNGSVTLVAPPGADADNHTFHEESWSIKPYPRKVDPNAMHSVRALTVRSVVAMATATDAAPPPACMDWHDVPALVFSVRGYTGNYFHAYTDVILPLFLTARQYSGEVLLLVTGFQAWWVGKYLPVFRSLSKYAAVDLDSDPRVHCFRRVQVGLTSHHDFSIDPRRAPNGYSMLDFAQFMRATYALPRDVLPLGPLEFVASYFRGPAGDMGLTYLEYRISPEESTLVDQYPRDHPVLTDPMSLSSKAKDWVSFMGVYLFKQDVRLDMKRFRPVLKKALARLRAKPKNNNN